MKKIVLTLSVLSAAVVGAYYGTGIIAEDQYKRQITQVNNELQAFSEKLGGLESTTLEIAKYERGIFASHIQILMGKEGVIEGKIAHGPLIFLKDGIQIGLFGDDLKWNMHGKQVGEINNLTRLTGEHTAGILLEQEDLKGKFKITVKDQDDYYVNVDELELPDLSIKGGSLSKNTAIVEQIQFKHDLPLTIKDFSFSTNMNLFNQTEILDKWKMSGSIYWEGKSLGKLTSKNQFEVRNHKGEKINPYLVDRDEYGLVDGDLSYTFIDKDNRLSNFSMAFKVNDFREMLYQIDQGAKTTGVIGQVKAQIDLKTVQSIFNLSEEQIKTIKVKLTEAEKVALSEDDVVSLGSILEMLDKHLEEIEQVYTDLYIEPNWLKTLITRKMAIGIYSGKLTAQEIVENALEEVDLSEKDEQKTLINIVQSVKDRYEQEIAKQQKDFVSYTKIHGDKVNVQLSIENGKIYSHGIEIKDETQFLMKGLDLIHN